VKTYRFVCSLGAALAILTFSLGVSGCGESAQPKPDADAQAPAVDAKPTPEPTVVAFAPKPPVGLPAVPIPDDNPMTPEKIELGKHLYFDKRLSKDGTISCATCHDPKMAWAEHRPSSEGIKGQIGDRNSPSVINTAYLASQFWDGRAATLEEQALGPIENPIEMGHKLDNLVKELAAIPGYKERFQKVFGTGVTKDGIAKAIAAFERTIVSGNSPYDKFVAGRKDALSEEQQRGMETFMGKGKCKSCHRPPIFVTDRFVNAGVGMDKKKIDEGLKKESKKADDLGKFRVPPLREAANTAPYFHDGSAATLADAVALMAAGGKDNPNLSATMKRVRSAKLTAQDKKDLVAFLEAISGEFPIIDPPDPLEAN
jgi:cytochrome c peroxidase